MLAEIPFDTLIFIALVLVASFFRWISKQAENARQSGEDEQEEERAATPIERQSGEGTDEERVRRFLEALGQPTTRPTPRVQRKTVVPKEKRVVVPTNRPIFSPLPPLTTVPPPLPPEAEMPSIPPSPPPVIEPEIIRPAAPVVIARESVLSPVSFPETASRTPLYSDVTALLSSDRGLRDAIILREIFGPPRSLQRPEF